MKRIPLRNDNSVLWHGLTRIGRLRLELRVYHHKVTSFSDRWVIQPSVIYDRKAR